MKRRTFLAGLGAVGASALAGCSSNGNNVTPEPVDEDGPEIYRDSTFYRGARVTSGPTLILEVAPSQNVHTEDEYVPADYVAVLNDGERVAYTPAVIEQTEYTFELPSYGRYKVVAAGEHVEGSEQSFIAEDIAILEVAEDGVVLEGLRQAERGY